MTILHWAAKRGLSNLLDFFIKRYNVNVKIKDNAGRTPLSIAKRLKHPKSEKIIAIKQKELW